MVRIGIVGIGFMGMIHYLAAGARGHGKVKVALCSRDLKKLAGRLDEDHPGDYGSRRGPRWTSRGSELGGISTWPTCSPTPAVDLVDLCVPNDEHRPARHPGAGGGQACARREA